MDGFATRLSDAGYRATLFVAPVCASAQAPLLEDLAAGGVEVGLLIHPPTLPDGRYRLLLGQYQREEQRAIVEASVEGYQDALGRRPLSARSAMYSANDDTFAVVYEHGFWQGSFSSPGRRIAKHGSVWTDAVPDAHYVDPASRLRRGELPFLEVPVTTDSSQERGGVAPELALESGTFEAWHKPLIEGQLQRIEEASVPFRVLCFTTRNSLDYRWDERFSGLLDALTSYLDSLEARYEVRSVTLSGAHESYRQLTRG